MNDNEFQLENPDPVPRQQKIEGREKSQQKVLFSGLDCLPGQLDLFNTDGSTEDCG